MNLMRAETDRNDDVKGGRRTDSERRQFSYTHHIPERRTGSDRRLKDDRRKEPRRPKDPSDKTPDDQ